jgi:hypothetical protein
MCFLISFRFFFLIFIVDELMIFFVKDFRPEHYVGPRLAVEAVCELIPNEKRSQVTVLDVAAGTGLVGLEVVS